MTDRIANAGSSRSPKLQRDAPFAIPTTLIGLGALGASGGLIAIAANSEGQPIRIAFLVFAAILGGIGAFSLGWRYLNRDAPKIESAFDQLMSHCADPAVLTDADGWVRTCNHAARAALRGGALRRARDLLRGVQGGDETVYRLLRIAAAGGSGCETLSLGEGRVLSVTAESIAEGRVIWRIEEQAEQVAAIVEPEPPTSEEIPVCRVVAGPDGRLRETNQALRDLIGAAPETLNALFCAPPKGAEDLCEVTTPDGTRQCVARCHLMAGAQGELLTEYFLMPMPRADAAAPSGSDSLPRFLLDAPFGAALLTPKGRIREINRIAESLLGEKAQAGAAFHSLLSQPDEFLEKRIADVATGRGSQSTTSIRVGGDVEKVVRLSLAGAMTQSGPAVLAYLQDGTEEANLKEQFAQSQKMQAVGQLAGGVAHDFNNLLTAIGGHCDLLLLLHEAGDPEFGDLMQIKQNANRAAGLVRQLLAFSRRQTLQPKVISLTDVLSDLSHLLNRLLSEKVVLTIEHGRNLGLIKVDQGQFEQVIINLAVNARDAMPEGGSVVICTSNVTHAAAAVAGGRPNMPSGDYVLIQVRDTGCGIPAAVLDKVFEPFFTTKKVGEGTGLGLSTVYGIVKQTGGFIFADSVVGEGTTFRIYLPRHAEEAVEPDDNVVVQEASGARADLTGSARILLVEDEDPVRAFAVRALETRGYTVMAAASGEEALELLAGGGAAVDLLVTDVVMPNMDGPSLVREVRKTRPDLQVIFMSGYAEEALRKDLEEGEHFRFLPKPFSLKQLSAKVKEVLGA